MEREPSVLAERGAERVEHSVAGGSLREHLQRVSYKLASWGAEPPLVAAGSFHAAYGTQGFPTALFRLAERAQLRELIGEEAEAIVYAYCALDRERYLRSGASELADRFRGERFTPSARMLRQLAELIAANELDVLESTQPSAAEAASIGELVRVNAPLLSEAARAAATTLQSQPDPEIAWLDLGSSGEPLLFWHGGASPELTWARQHSLAAEYRLRIPWRRGFSPSAAASVQDWEQDARDLLRIMPGAVHVVAHSLGGVSAVVAAARAPKRFRSLVLIEPPLWAAAEQHPEVGQLVQLSRAYLAGDPDARAAFFALAGLPLDLPDVERIERQARNLRDPGEARPDVARLRAARVPIVVASGDHARGLERLCDELAQLLGAARWQIRGAGHGVQRHPAFNDRLRELLAAQINAGPE